MPRDRPKRALTCRQCKHYGHCIERDRMYPCTSFQPQKDGMDSLDWLYIGILIIGIYAGMIVTYIALA
jgi:hypothetical protein